MTSTKVEHTFLKKGRLVKIYTDGRFDYALSVNDFIKLSNRMRDAVRATGPVSVRVLEIDTEDSEIPESQERSSR